MESENDEEVTLLKDDKVTVNESKPKRSRIFTVACILLTEVCERLAYYSVVANLVLFCTSVLDITTTNATTVTLIFTGTIYIIAVSGGYIADAIAGKYKTILGSGLVYSLGLFLLSTSAFDFKRYFGEHYALKRENLRIIYFIGLACIAIGTGGIKANIGPFGAEQIKDLGSKAVQSFFIWFYWFIQLGALAAHIGVAYIQQNIGFSLGYLVPLIFMIFGLVVFLCGKKTYVHSPPKGGVVLNFVQILIKAKFFKFKKLGKSRGGTYSDDLVTDVVNVLKMLPIYSLMILYWAVYSQLQSTFFLQGERMDIPWSKVPVAVLQAFNDIIILIFLPVLDLIVYPLLAKHKRNPTILQRIGFGLFLSCVTVLAAGVLEMYRKNDLSSSGGKIQILSNDTFNASTISIFAQIPQFALMGASEMCSSVSGLEFAYSEAPDYMQGFVMGAFFVTIGIGNYVSSGLLEIIKLVTVTDSWFPEEINNGKLENLFFLLAFLMLLNAIIFVFVARCYKYQTRETVTTNTVLEHDKRHDSLDCDDDIQ